MTEFGELNPRENIQRYLQGGRTYEYYCQMHSYGRIPPQPESVWKEEVLKKLLMS